MEITFKNVPILYQGIVYQKSEHHNRYILVIGRQGTGHNFSVPQSYKYITSSDFLPGRDILPWLEGMLRHTSDQTEVVIKSDLTYLIEKALSESTNGS
jgi:hypothetical protein